MRPVMHLDDVDFLCLMGAEIGDCAWVAPWLNASLKRRLVLIDVDAKVLEGMRQKFLDCLQVKYRLIESPLQIEPLAKQTAWQAVFLKIAVAGDDNETFRKFRDILEKTHLAANLLLSDAADCGCLLLRHRRARKQHPVRQGLKLAGAFTKIPAIIVGAGPSLEKNGHLLAQFRDRALILAGGNALNVLAAEPHFTASIDKEAPYRDFKRHPFWEAPFCFQSRMNPENFSLIHGEALWFPDGHHSFLNWIDGEEEVFDGGWTVGNFLTAVALLMGCDPIVLVGMDLCYEGTSKYAYTHNATVARGLIEVKTEEGKKVLTQQDWLMARLWFEDLATRNPDRQFIDAREGGLEFRPPIQCARLDSLVFEERKGLQSQVHQAIQELPLMEGEEERWPQWEESLQKCKELATSSLFGGEENFSGEIAYEKLLSPLWQTWRSIFERELELDPQNDEGKLKLNRFLFFQRVIQEHLDAI